MKDWNKTHHMGMKIKGRTKIELMWFFWILVLFAIFLIAFYFLGEWVKSFFK